MLRDYTLIIDKSGSMAIRDQYGGKSRWQIMQEATLALAHKCEKLDSDGITVYTFSGRFRRYAHVTASKVEQIFQENKPSGRTDLASVLQDAFHHYFESRAAGKTKANGETIIVVTDGEPDDRQAVIKTIIDASCLMKSAQELGLFLIQVGNDREATRFLNILDHQLQTAGAKFDLVDTITIDNMQDQTLPQVLVNTIDCR